MADGVGVYFQTLPIWWTPYAMSSDGCVEANQPLTFQWNEQNTGDADASYGDDIYLDGNYLETISLSLAHGATEEREYTISAGADAGDHTVVIVINTGDAVAEGFTQQTVQFCTQ